MLILIGGATKKAAMIKMGSNKEFGGFTEEVLSALKLVIAFGNEDVALDIFRKKGEVAAASALKMNK